MKITHLKLTNWRGLSPIDQDLPAICFVQGANESGKTSFLDAILYLWEKGHDEENITKGAEKAEVIATMEDGLQLRTLLTRGDGTTRMTKKPGAKKWTVSRAEIDALVNGISFNPLTFCQMTPKEQLALILKVAPIDLPIEELVEAVKVIGTNPPLYNEGRPIKFIHDELDPLSQIETLRKLVYDERTVVNRQADVQKKHAGELEASLGEAKEERDWGVEIARLESAAGAVQERLDDRKEVLRADIESASEVAREQCRLEIKAAEEKRDKAIQDAKNKANKAWETFSESLRAEHDKLTTDLATARERDRLSVTQSATRKTAQIAKQAHAQLVKQSDSLTAAIENLDKLQATIAGRLKLPIRFVDGVIHNEKGIPITKWNEATRILFSLRLAVMMNPNFIVIDKGLEQLDPQHRLAFTQRAQELAAEKGIQFFVASITANPELSTGTVENV